MQIYAVLKPAVNSSKKSVNMNGLKRHKKNRAEPCGPALF